MIFFILSWIYDYIIEPLNNNKTINNSLTKMTMTDCSICLDKIDNVNCTMTSCGHCFHTTCLITNVQHNGLGCPYCRTKIADEVEEEDNTEEVWDSWETNDELYEDHALAGFRMFHQRLNGEEVEEEEEEEDDLNDDASDDSYYTNLVRPSPAFIARKLAEQGVTMEDLVKVMVGDHDEYGDYQDNRDIQRIEGEIFGKFRIIISNFKEGDEPTVPTTSQQVEEPSPLVTVRNRQTTFIGYGSNIRNRILETNR